MDDSLSNSPSLSSDSPYIATAADAAIFMYSLSDSYSSQNPNNKNEEETNKNEDVTSKNAEAPHQMEDERAEQIIEKPTQNPKISTKRRTRCAKIRSESSSSEEKQDQEKDNDRERTSDQEEANSVGICNLALENERETERGLNLPRNLKEIIEVSSGDLDENKNAEMDIMEVGKMKMKELETERPSWHRVGGYPDL